jgi:DNA-binding phage protein
MALTRDFKQTIVERVNRDPEFARALLSEASALFVNGEPETARRILRDLVNATTGFGPLADEISIPVKSLDRMLSVTGNPSMENLSAIFMGINRKLNVRIETKVVKKGKGKGRLIGQVLS